MKNDIQELLKFPCSFPIKIMGVNSDDLLPEVIAIITKHVDNFNPQTDITTKPSSKGNYLAITVTIIATSKQQLDIIYQELHKHKLVKVML
jgi:uncharacterized protein